MTNDTTSDVRRRLEAVSEVLATRIVAIQEGAAKAVVVAVRAADLEKEVLLQRLMSARIAEPIGNGGRAQSEPRAASGETPRSARWVILKVLSDAKAPVPVGVLNAAVAAAGWTQAAADKMRTKLKREGLATAEMKMWTITEEGRRTMSE